MTGPRNKDIPVVKNTLVHMIVSKYHSLLKEHKAPEKNNSSLGTHKKSTTGNILRQKKKKKELSKADWECKRKDT